VRLGWSSVRAACCIHETNYVPMEYSVAAVLLLLFMGLISVVSVCIFILVLPEVRVQCPIWLFSGVP